MKLEVVVDRVVLPLGLAWAGAKVSEQALFMPPLGDIPLELPQGIPVVADKGHDFDALRLDIEEATCFVPVIPHRRNRVRPSRNAVRWSYYSFVD